MVFFGDYIGNGVSGGADVKIFGDLKPGSSPGTAEFGGDVALTSSTSLIIELAGTAAGIDHDELVVTGQLTADGTLDVQLLDEYKPLLGDTFDVLDFGSVTGDFVDVTLPTLSEGLAFDTSSLLTTGSISVVPEPTSAMLASFLGVIGLSRYRTR